LWPEAGTSSSLANDKAAQALRQPTRLERRWSQSAKEFAMRGSTIDQVRDGIDHGHADDKVSNQIDAAEKAAGLQSMHPPVPDDESDHGLWFAVGAGISAAAIVVAVALT
jgi:hypothetical protein